MKSQCLQYLSRTRLSRGTVICGGGELNGSHAFHSGVCAETRGKRNDSAIKPIVPTETQVLQILLREIRRVSPSDLT